MLAGTNVKMVRRGHIYVTFSKSTDFGKSFTVQKVKFSAQRGVEEDSYNSPPPYRSTPLVVRVIIYFL